ncbi:MAG: phosphate-starvation-inducible PsiE family protein [Halochromatium sp.]
MVALARHLIIGMKTMTDIQLIATSVAVLILALAVLVVGDAHVRFAGRSDVKANQNDALD